MTFSSSGLKNTVPVATELLITLDWLLVKKIFKKLLINVIGGDQKALFASL